MANRPRPAPLVPLLAAILGLSATGCAIQWSPRDAAVADAFGAARPGLSAEATGEAAAASLDATSLAGPGSAGAGLAVGAQRLLVHTGELRLAVAAPEEAARVTLAFVQELGGYAQSVTGQTLVLRVPAPRFFDAVERAARLGRLLDKRITAQDVTEEVVDLRLRLQNALALRQRLEALLARAASVKEVLEIETELTRVRTEVERIEGRLKVLESQVALSTLTLHFVPSAVAVRTGRLPFSWLGALGVESLIGRDGGR